MQGRVTRPLTGSALTVFRYEPAASWLVVVVSPAGNAAAETQRRIYESSAKGMSERSIVLTEAADDSERSRLSADVRRFEVFLVGKDGHTAVSSDKAAVR